MLCLTDDPLDPPGWERFGGGHLFVFDLGRYLVRLGFQVDYLTRRNAAFKLFFESLGPLCTLTRLDVGPTTDLAPLDLHAHLDDLTIAAQSVVRDRPAYDVIHSHNWLSGAVARAVVSEKTRHVHSILSLGRLRLALGEESIEGDSLRDELEVQIFRDADVLVAVAPSEREDLLRLYPEVQHDRIVIVPYGIDPEVFDPRPQSPDHFILRQARRSAQGSSELS
ncbi:MAG TPA: glycosyltransferase [Thermoanaerobaculia bacterium]|nr:glycosyltransferase [Thermoanaerobaculia bacterium]